jgi:hypothetical protein
MRRAFAQAVVIVLGLLIVIAEVQRRDGAAPETAAIAEWAK